MAARFAMQAPPSAPRIMTSTFRVATSAPTVPIYNDDPPAYASANIAGEMKLKNYKTGEDVEIFLERFTNFCTGTSVPPSRQASVLLNALEDTTFRVVSKELNESEKTNISTLKAYMTRRVKPARGPGQLRLLFRQSKQEAYQDMKEFYTDLLGKAAKAFGNKPEEIEGNVLDQFVAGIADNKIRLHLIEKNPTTSKEACDFAVAYKNAQEYN